MRVIGTAGHVDHGKSTLVTALTGINPDRLKEEQAREMTIELGFAWLNLPGGEAVGVVDVPGHRDFIENMLAGVGGIDAVVFVVAADEGVMPQTREHLMILDLLKIPAGVIVFTKADLIDDADWFDLLEMDVRQAAQGTILEHAPMVRVSARTGVGIIELKQKLAEIMEGKPPRPDFGRPRLAVDRVFTMAGFGTVVTGTLLDGRLKVGDEVVILPAGTRGRIRGLQTFKQKVEAALPGSRTAVNISGVDNDQIGRGDVLSLPGKYQPTRRMDVYFELHREASSHIRHNSEVKFFLGAAEVTAKVRLLGGLEELKPGNNGWLQLELVEPVVAARGDRYILRRPSPGETLGGGVIIEPGAEKRHKRSALDVIERLEALRRGSPRDVLLQAWSMGGIVSLRDVAAKSRLSAELIAQTVDEMLQGGELVALEPGKIAATSDILMAASPAIESLWQDAKSILGDFHQAYPLRKGMSREELKSRLSLPNRPFNALMRTWFEMNGIMEKGALVAMREHKVTYSAQHTKTIQQLYARFISAPYTPPSVKECQEAVGEELFAALVESGELVQVSADVVFRAGDYADLVNYVRLHLAKEGKLSVGEFRDQFNTSRKYVLGFLEHLDSLGITRREGDFRVAGRK